MSETMLGDLKFPNEHNRKRMTLGNGIGKTSGEPQTLSRRAATFFEQVEDLQRERDSMRHALDTANARIEQYQSNETRLLSELETERARTAAAKEEAEQARVARAQLETVITGMVNMGSDALG